MADDLHRAFAHVGQFLHHFALLEKEIDQSLAKLLKFTPAVANLITRTMSFTKRFQFVYAVTLNYFHDEDGRTPYNRTPRIGLKSSSKRDIETFRAWQRT